MQFVRGAAVFSATGKELGRVDLVVLKPETKEVTHVVVRRGSRLGPNSDQAKIVPVDLIASAIAERVDLKPDVPDWQELTDFKVTQYVVVDEEELKHDVPLAPSSVPTVFSYPAYIPGPPVSGSEPAYMKETEENIPEGTVALKEGARVVSVDGRHIGNVERVLADSNERMTHLVISKGRLLKRSKLLPAAWVQKVEEEQVLLTVDANSVERLEDYDGQASGPP